MTAPQWRDVHDLVQETKRDILEAIDDLKVMLSDHETRIRSIENIGLERRSAQRTQAFFLGLPVEAVRVGASGAALVAALIAVWTALGRP